MTSTVLPYRSKNKAHDASFNESETARSKTGYGTTNLDVSMLNQSTDANNITYLAMLPKSKTLPRISLDKSRENKTYRAPPTPPPDVLISLERSFTLDCIAVGNISDDYSVANPKLGSAIPPYDSINDPHVKNYMKNYGLKDLMSKTLDYPKHESIPGKVHDRFHSSGLGHTYLSARNKFGNGHTPENFEGHRRFMGDQMRVMFSYSNMNGYKRNVPRLRTSPSTFSVDPRWLQRMDTFKKEYTNEEIRDHFEKTYLIGNPFTTDDYRDFHPMVRYFITVKIGNAQPDVFKENLYVNIIARNYHTGFIKLDKSIVLPPKIAAPKTAKFEGTKSNMTLRELNDKATEEQKAIEKMKLFEKNQSYTFLLEDKDLRMIQGLILYRDGKSEKTLFIDSIVLEVHKPSDKKIFRFPFNGWLGVGKQSRKIEQLKGRFSIKDSVVVFPNELPKYEYKIKTTPQLFSNCEYKVQLSCDVKDLSVPITYTIKLSNNEMSVTGVLTVKLIGSKGSTDYFQLSGSKVQFMQNDRDIEEIQYVHLKYVQRSSKAKQESLSLKDITVVRSDVTAYTFSLNEDIELNKEYVYPVSTVSPINPEEKEEYVPKPSYFGAISIRLDGDKSSTNIIHLTHPFLSSDKKTFVFRKYETNIGKFEGVHMKFADKDGIVCHINHMKIFQNGKLIYESEKNLSIAHNEEAYLPDPSKMRTRRDPKNKPQQLLVKLVGDDGESEYVTLEDPVPCKDGTDEFTISTKDVGIIKKVHLKYKGGDNSKVSIDTIEIVDPRNKEYSYPIEGPLENNREKTLPKSDDDYEDDFKSKSDKDSLAQSSDSNLDKNATASNKPKPVTKSSTDSKTPQKKTPQPTSSSVKKTPTATQSSINDQPKSKTPSKETTKSASKKDDDFEKEIEYEITTKTGSKISSGTDANVYIKINGEKGSTKEIHLISSNTDKLFEVGVKDLFQERAENVGKIKSIDIRHDGKGLASGWYLDSVEVKTKTERLAFPVDRWLAVDEADGRIALTLIPGEKPAILDKKPNYETVSKLVPGKSKRKDEE